MLSRPAKIVIAFLVAAGAFAIWAAWPNTREPVAASADALPPGRWARAPGADRAMDGDRADLLSLPYVQGKVAAGDRAGVLVHDPGLAFDGLNLYCSGHAPEAILMDMQGRVLHRWSMPFAEAFPQLATNQESVFFRRVALLPDGDLVALFQGKGLVRLDRDSGLVWARAMTAFNDLWADPDGTLLVLAKRATIVPSIHPREPVLEDFVVELSPAGEEVGTISLLDLLRRSPWAELLAGMESQGDILHSNTVARLDGSVPHPAFAPGRLLVSLRQVSVLAVVDPAIPEVAWARRGSWRRQHEPVALANGHVLLFDNQGAAGGGARAIEIDPTDGEVVWSWGEEAGQNLVSPEGGTVARLANGNTLVTASESGRALEVDPEGTIVWEFVSPHRAGPEGALVATLWEMQRVDRSQFAWLAPADGDRR